VTEVEARMLEGYKDIAGYIATKYQLTYDPATVRGWKYKDALPVQRARKKVYIASDVFDRWFERTILERA
jgi:hypothetical protein